MDNANIDWMVLCLSGGGMPDADVAELERALRADPDRLELRVKRLGSLSWRGDAQRGEDILWLVVHHPEVDLGGFVFMAREDAPEQFDLIRQAWNAHLESSPDNPGIIERAAEFSRLEDPSFTEELFRRGARLEPSKARWPQLLGDALLHRSAQLPEPAAEASLAAEALTAYERAYEMESWGFAKHLHVIEIAKAAVAASRLERAVEAANQALAEAPSYEQTWLYGNSVHWAHIVLGRAALLRGDAPAAADQLILAGGTRGSPQLDSFGPDLLLARKLLESGERAAVERYLVECQRFWKLGRGRLARWVQQLRDGALPDLAEAVDRSAPCTE